MGRKGSLLFAGLVLEPRVLYTAGKLSVAKPYLYLPFNFHFEAGYLEAAHAGMNLLRLPLSNMN